MWKFSVISQVLITRVIQLSLSLSLTHTDTHTNTHTISFPPLFTISNGSQLYHQVACLYFSHELECEDEENDTKPFLSPVATLDYTKQFCQVEHGDIPNPLILVQSQGLFANVSNSWDIFFLIWLLLLFKQLKGQLYLGEGCINTKV